MRFQVLAATAAAVVSVSSAHAGGFTTPVVQTEPIVAVDTAPVTGSWQGGYAGASLGYAFGGDDAIGLSAGETVVDTIGTAEIGGPNVSLRAGYRWQRNNWVVGPEASYTFGDISDEFDFGADNEFEASADNILALKLKTGYIVRPDTLVYGIAGWQKGNFTYSIDGDDVEYDADGYVVGLGVERMITDRMSVTGEYEYSNFGNTDIEFPGGRSTAASPTFSNVKVGMNFKF